MVIVTVRVPQDRAFFNRGEPDVDAVAADRAPGVGGNRIAVAGDRQAGAERHHRGVDGDGAAPGLRPGGGRAADHVGGGDDGERAWHERRGRRPCREVADWDVSRPRRPVEGDRGRVGGGAQDGERAPAGGDRVREAADGAPQVAALADPGAILVGGAPELVELCDRVAERPGAQQHLERRRVALHVEVADAPREIALRDAERPAGDAQLHGGRGRLALERGVAGLQGGKRCEDPRLRRGRRRSGLGGECEGRRGDHDRHRSAATGVPDQARDGNRLLRCLIGQPAVACPDTARNTVRIVTFGCGSRLRASGHIARVPPS